MKKKIILISSFLIIISSYSFCQTVYKNYVDGEIYFKLNKEVPFIFDTLHRDVDINGKLNFLYPLLARYNITKAEASFYFSKSDTLKRTFKLKFDNIKLVDKLIHELQALNVIEYAEKVPLNKLDYTPNDYYFADSSLSGQWGLYKINAKKAWDVTRGSRSIVIAVVDNAVDTSHPDIKPNVVSARDVSDNDNNPRPPRNDNEWEHGTHTSGTACAVTNNYGGVASIGFNCGLMAIKATHDVTGNDSGNYINDGFAGISWAVANGASIISCSWGDYSYSTTEQNVINNAYTNNVLIVAAAGNDNFKDSLFYPAAYNHVLSVAATDNNDKKAYFSNYGSWVDASAPGISILSTFPGNAYGYLQGTSMATPLVAGLCGLVRSVNPSLSVDQVINIIVSNCDNINAQNPLYVGLLGGGRINAYKAVESALQCVSSINLGAGNYAVPKTESSGSITSSNTISSGAAVIFDAATTVYLLPGFHAYSGTFFDAYIDGCGGNKFYNSYAKNKKIPQQDQVTKVIQSAIQSTKFNVYPNPTTSIVHFDFTTDKDESNVVIQVFNVQMQQVKEIKLGNLVKGKQSATLNLSGLSAGVYFLTLQLQSEKLTAKISIIN